MSSGRAACPALFFCAPASGQGKTTVTAGLARHYRNQGLKVRVFKTGPDYLDPLVLERASGSPVIQLDLWMVGEASCRHLMYQAAREADLVLVEGVMGMFDGNPSGADMAEFFGIPVAIVIDARSMAQTFAAVALGLAGYRPGLGVAGVIANAVGSRRHRELIEAAMPQGLKLLGCLDRSAEPALPERHLGLVHPREVSDMDQRLDHLADRVAAAGLTELPGAVEFEDAAVDEPPALLSGIKIGIARDDAFSFIYAANVELLENMGAECVYFSPLSDSRLPDADALWFPGGYPELHLDRLSSNETLKHQLHDFHAGGGRIVAECGGMLYLMEGLTDIHGRRAPMVSLLPGEGIMRRRGGCQGMQTAPLPEGDIRAHAHHRTRCENTLPPLAQGRRLRHPAPGEPIYRLGGITASYLHLYFPSNPKAVAALFSP